MAEIINDSTVTLDLSQWGIDQKVQISDLEAVVNGKDVSGFPFRSEEETQKFESKMLPKMQKHFSTNLPKNIQESVGAMEAAISHRQGMIQDPIGTMLKSGADKAKMPGAPGFGSVLKEGLIDIWPGGPEFEPERMKQGAMNTIFKLLATGDPKQTMTDMGVVATDVAISAKALQDNNLPNSRNIKTASLWKKLQKNPALAFASILGANVFTKGAGNEAYDLINDATRVIMNLPNPDEAYEKDETIRNLIDLRREAIWSGGAMGLQHIWPLVKPWIGKNMLGIDKKATDLMKAGERNMVPMNTFSVSKNGFVNAMGKVVGLFPFVATRARQAQNAQQVAIADAINRTLNDLSPISLFADSGMLASKAFRETVQSFSATKALFYKRAMDIGKKVDAKFIPMERIKRASAEFAEEMGIGKGDIKLDIPDPSGYGTKGVSLDELLKPITGKAQDFRKILAGLAHITDDHINAQQWANLQMGLNDLLRGGSAALDLGDEFAGSVRNFTNVMIETINDTGAFKNLDDAAKDALTKEFSSAYGMANEFFFKNRDLMQGRTAQVLSMADKNITKHGAPISPGFFTEDMMTKMLLSDDSLLAPLAIKEMRSALGKTKALVDGKWKYVDAFDAMARSVIDNKIRNATKYISGSVRIADEINPAQGWNPFSKIEPAQKLKNATFNIPILDVDVMKDAFGITNPNKLAGMTEILGEAKMRDIKEILELADNIQQTNFGNVSDFVKRRGFLGGVNAITNIMTAGWVASNPFGNVGLMLMARYGMSKLADPQFLKGLSQVINPEMSDLARRQALITVGRISFDNLFGDETETNIPASLRDNFDSGNPMDVMKLLMFGSNNDMAYPGAETMLIQTDENGYATGAEINKSQTQNMFSADAMSAGEDLAMMNAEQAVEKEQAQQADMPVDRPDPFLNVDFADVVEQAGVGMGSGAQKALTEDQRVALAGGNLDEALALGTQRRA